MRMMKTLLLLLLYSPAAWCQAGAQDSKVWLDKITHNALPANKPGKYQKAAPGPALYFSQAGDIKMPYIVYVPKGYDAARPSPVFVFLHGAILARDSFMYRDTSIADEPIFLVADSLNAIAIFPFARRDFAWNGQGAANEQVVIIIKQAEELYNVDKGRVYIGGISMGGNATYWYMHHHQELFAGFYAFSSMPKTGGDGVEAGVITKERPLYTSNAKNDEVFAFEQVNEIYEQHKIPDWHFYAVDAQGHRFIYKPGGWRVMIYVMGKMLRGEK